ncbi:uncharacterized protein F4812DRAFT_432553 [Daldinia caldariorum]|uniref:uncharacterized protein n=1 Tax=Daldinia caldariorum TaxID=326644 RepID=UPI0020089EDF|nr:uncharacterized protein F4812DRAFT_432553 [Daldinia caldariorum]KAI1466720.1 hypothetical protein F4812DRAFT_432553 [Daldinia caldariorum]
MEPKRMSRTEAGGAKPSTVYQIIQAIMTPVHFISFLLSLYLVDCRYHAKRIQEHSARYSRLPTWLLPSWLDRLLFSPHPYGWVDRKKQDGAAAAGSGAPGGERWYYHTKQKKLMKMETADAFEMQRSVLLGLGVVALFAVWVFWRLGAGIVAWFTS